MYWEGNAPQPPGTEAPVLVTLPDLALCDLIWLFNYILCHTL